MASKWPPVKNSAFKFRASLFAQSDNQIKAAPTLAAGDFKVSIDGGAFANLATLPSEEQTGMLEIDLSSDEMNGDEIVVKAVDAAGDEWHSAMWVIHTVGQTFDTVDGNIDAILVDTAEIGAAGAGLTEAGGTGDHLTAVPWNAAWDAEVQSEVTDALEVALSDSVPADGSLPSLKQAMYMVVQYMMERSVSGTTVTVKKVDGSTSLLTLTLDDATAPTSITRAS